MSRIRFATARDVFVAFPAARDDIGAEPTDEPPLAFLLSLAAGETPEDALGFFAYVLPRREVVWWACQCMRVLLPSPAAEDQAALCAAEDWAREPEEHRRRLALRLGIDGDRRSPTSWVALAAGWSGGYAAPAGHGSVAPEPHMTARAIRVAVLTALARVGARERAARLKACLDTGLPLLDNRGGVQTAG